MSRVRLFTPDATDGHSIELHANDTVLVGRMPDQGVAKVRDVIQRDVRIQRLPIASPSISTNHAVIQAHAGRVSVTDLGSRNGTWVQVPRAASLTLDAVSEVRVRIGDAPATTGSDTQEFPLARWTNAEDFAEAVASMASEWLRLSDNEAQVSIVDSSLDEPPSPGTVRIPLSAGQRLDVRLLRTVDTDWTGNMSRLWSHVASLVAAFEAEAASRAEGMILTSDAIRLAHRQVIAAAKRGERLMILGPSGSGKELLARAYHRHAKPDGPFVAINCAELDDRIRAELFGTETGAFTGAVKRAGAIEAANGGTLFLDEIGELPLDVQATLLRFLDRGEYARMGDLARTRKVDVQVVCATNRDLKERIRQDRFRLDLWFRLAAHVVEVPPLHLRLDDLRTYLRLRSHTGARSTWVALSSEAQEVVEAHHWESHWGGNFRELENFAARLPDARGAGSIDVVTARHALELGSVARPKSTRSAVAPELSSTTWTEIAAGAGRLAAQSYLDEHGNGPTDWNAVKAYIENYLKPVLFAQLAGVGDAPTLEAVRKKASSLGADRATRLKQLERYFERFSPSTS